MRALRLVVKTDKGTLKVFSEECGEKTLVTEGSNSNAGSDPIIFSIGDTETTTLGPFKRYSEDHEMLVVGHGKGQIKISLRTFGERLV